MFIYFYRVGIARGPVICVSGVVFWVPGLVFWVSVCLVHAGRRAAGGQTAGGGRGWLNTAIGGVQGARVFLRVFFQAFSGGFPRYTNFKGKIMISRCF